MRTRVRPAHLGWSFAAFLLAAGCAGDFDTSRSPPKRGTLGEEVYGVLCTRVGAQALSEDLAGDSFHGICHKGPDGLYVDKVDTKLLPTPEEGAVDATGKVVPLDTQNTRRAAAIGRIETMGRHRGDIVAALDALFPGDATIPLKNLGAADPTQSCKPPSGDGPAEAKLSEELANLLARMTDLYNDGTVPQSTRAMARVMNVFKATPDAQRAWARLDARQGYRPLEVALGAARPVLAYPRLRDLTNVALSLLSPDSSPYDPNAEKDKDGARIPTPGALYDQFSALLSVAHEELRTSVADPALAQLTVATDATTGRALLSRPRSNLEMIQEIFYAQDAAFGTAASRYIVRRDARGFAMVPLAGGKVPAPFVDKNNDLLPDTDELGRFVTTSGAVPPTPFLAFGAPTGGARDKSGRALAATGGAPLYQYIDTSRTFTSQLLGDTQALLVPDPAKKHETLMYALSGAYTLFGAKGAANGASKKYASPADIWKTATKDPLPEDIGTDAVTLKYTAYNTDTSPLVDFVYALGQVMADPTTDDTLALVKQLFVSNTADLARTIGAALAAKELADKHSEAMIPAKSVFWDDMLAITATLGKEPGLLESVLRALGTDDASTLGTIFGNYMQFHDRITYDPNDLNGPPTNLETTDKSEMRTKVDRSKPDSSWNKSGWHRFIQLLHDSNGVTSCNKDGAVMHAKGVPLLGSLDIPSTMWSVATVGRGATNFKECQVFRIDGLSKFYLQSVIGNANFYIRDDLIRGGIIGSFGAADTAMLEASSGLTGWMNNGKLTGFWGTGQDLRPRPEWLNRLVFFDVSAPGNDTTRNFIRDLNGPHMGTVLCPKRAVTDPVDGTPVPGLRACQDGDWLDQRDANTIFIMEQFGFYKAMAPLLKAFCWGDPNHASNGDACKKLTADPSRDGIDLFIDMVEILYKHWASDKASASDCKLTDTENCTKDGASRYEALLAEVFLGDMMPSLNSFVKKVDALRVKRCKAVDSAGMCTQSEDATGIDVLAEATRALVDPDRAKTAGLKYRNGKAEAQRNDGTKVAQVTPVYLLVDALNGFDARFAATPDGKARQAEWKTARSQLVDQFLKINGAKEQSTFANAGIPRITPTIVDATRAQLFAHCPKTFVPPYERCAWARDELTKKLTDTMKGPLFALSVDLVDQIRQNAEARFELEALLVYLLDAASKNDALAAMLASTADLVQVLADDQNLMPLFRLLSEATTATVRDEQGTIVQPSVVDTSLALLGRIAGKALDQDGNQVCARELDPNQVLTPVLSRLVTPIPAANPGDPSRTPLEIMIDAIADINRQAPGDGTKLQAFDYANIADNVSDFLLNKERGIEQFYEIVRQGTKDR